MGAVPNEVRSATRRRRRRFGRVYKRPGGPGFLLQVPTGGTTASGRSKYATRSFRTREEAEQALKEVEKAVVLGAFGIAAPRQEPACELTLLAAIDAYLDAKRAEGAAESGVRRYLVSRGAIARAPLGDQLVRDLQPRDVESYMAWRREHKWRAVRKVGSKPDDPTVTVVVRGEAPSNSSVNRDLALVSAALGRLVRLGQLDRNPAARVRRGREPVRARAILSKEEVATLLDACDENFRPFVAAQYFAGQRPSELLAVQWGDVNFGNKTLTVFRTKVGLGDSIPLHPAVGAELKALKDRRAREGRRVVQDDEHVFLSKAGRPHYDYRCPWHAALKRAGLDRRKGLTLYSLRHSFATHYLEHGAPSDLQQIMGHASYSTTARYVRAVSARARAGIEALAVGGGAAVVPAPSVKA